MGASFRRKTARPETTRRLGVLRQMRDAKGTRDLGVRLEQGAVVIEGRDYGDGVEAHFGPGNREYEWVWTVLASEVPKLRKALGSEDPIAGLAARFSDEKAADLKSFLDEAGIRLEAWSRVGD